MVFITADHNSLLQRLKHATGTKANGLQWFESYLSRNICGSVHLHLCDTFWCGGKVELMLCTDLCIPGECRSFHMASVPKSDLSSLPTTVWAAPPHPGAHTGHQTQVSKNTGTINSWTCLLWWTWPTVVNRNINACVLVCASEVITEQGSVWTWGRWSLISPVSSAKTRSG